MRVLAEDAVLDRVVRKGFSGVETFEQRPEWSEGEIYSTESGGVVRAEGQHVWVSQTSLSIWE